MKPFLPNILCVLSSSSINDLSTQVLDLRHQNHQIQEEIDKLQNKIKVSSENEQKFKHSNYFITLQKYKNEIHQLQLHLKDEYAKYCSFKQEIAQNNAAAEPEIDNNYEIIQLKNNYKQAKHEFDYSTREYEKLRKSQIAEAISLREQIEFEQKNKNKK